MMNTEPLPEKKIGLLSSTALVIGNMIGSGVFLLPASLAAFGGISLLGWVFSSLGAIILAVIFGNLSRLIPNSTGGPYAFTKATLGEFPGFLVAWGYWISVWITNAAITVALVSYLSVFFPVLVENPLAAILTGLGFIWTISWLNTRGIKKVGLVQLVTTIIKITPLVLIGVVGIFYIEADNFLPFNSSGTSDAAAITATTVLTLFAFLGMESATIPNSSIKKPGSTIKKATVIGTGITIFIYIAGSAAVMGILPRELLVKSNAPFADAASLIWGEPARYAIAVGAIVATLGALNGWILIQGQIPMAAAKDKMFPRVFGIINKEKSPYIGIIISSILVSALMMFKYNEGLVEAFTFMILLATLSVLTPYLFSTAGYALMLYKNRAEQPKITGKLILAFLAFCFSIWILIGCGAEVVYWGFILLVLGIPFYVLMKRKEIKNG